MGRRVIRIRVRKAQGLNRSMCPVIRRMDGSKVWTGVDTEPEFVISDGIVVYAHTTDNED
ncbi:MAG: hypothetical protein ABJA67_15355 [Chthonomonadales bacterium]